MKKNEGEQRREGQDGFINAGRRTFYTDEEQGEGKCALNLEEAG